MKYLIIIFLLFSVSLSAPPVNSLTLFRGEGANPNEKMLIAFEFVESSFDCDTINSLGYGGILQIGQQMTDEVNRINRITGNPLRFTLVDRLDSTKAVQMWYIVMNYWNPSYDLVKATKIWNPLASENYYNKIRKYLIMSV